MFSLFNLLFKKNKKNKLVKENVNIKHDDLNIDIHQLTVIKEKCRCEKGLVIIGEEKLCLDCIKKTSKNYTEQELKIIENKINVFNNSNL